MQYIADPGIFMTPHVLGLRGFQYIFSWSYHASLLQKKNKLCSIYVSIQIYTMLLGTLLLIARGIHCILFKRLNLHMTIWYF